MIVNMFKIGTLKDYRGLYESSLELLQQNIVSDIALMLLSTGVINFRKKNTFEFDGNKIVGMLLQQDGMFIVLEDSIFELDDSDDTFKKFNENPYNLIKLYESMVNETGFEKKKKK